jgi:hypothetical protein
MVLFWPAILGYIAPFLLSIVGTLAARILTALSIGTVTYYGLSTLIESLMSHVQNSYSGTGGNVAAILGLLGIPSVISIIGTGFTTRVSLTLLKRFAPYTS